MAKAKNAARQVDDFYVRLLTRGKAQEVEIGAPDTDPIARIIDAITGSIVRFVGSRAQDAELTQRLQPDRVLVRTIPPAQIGALTMWIAPRHVVAVNRGLALFLYRLARAFSPLVITRGPGDPPAPPESQAVGIIATLLDWMASPVRAPIVEDWPVGPRETRTAENFTTAAERFVVAHEIAHIQLGHLIADAAAVDLADSSPLELDTRPVSQEIQADVIGACLAIESMQNDGIDPRAAVTGIHFFLQALQLGEMLGAIHVDEAHPPAEERLKLCDDAIDQRYGSHAPLLRTWAKSTDELLGRLAAAALQERDQRRAAVAARMDEMLRTTTWRMGRREGKRDMALLKEAQSLMSQSPSAVVEALAANLLDPEAYTQLAKAARSPDALEEDDRWRRHQVAHFLARNSPAPVKRSLGVETIGG